MIPLLVLLQLAAPTRFELPNGLRAWIQEDHRRPVALVQVTYKAGSLAEEPGKTGLAHYVEHMVYRATQHIQNEDVYGYIDRIGGRYTGGTWPEFTRYAETVPAWAVESALRVTAERMCCALFDSTEFERERHNVVTEANGFSDMDPLTVMRDAVLYSAFDVHPYRLNSDSWARDNLVLSRDDAFRWYKDHYGPNNAVLVIVGDVATDSVRQLVVRHFGSIARAPGSGQITVVEPPQRAEKRVTVVAPNARPEMDVVYHAPAATDRDFAALTVVTRLLQQRLPAALRDISANGIVAVTDSASQYPYLLRVMVQADSAAALDRALVALDREVERLARGDVPDAQLAVARAAVLSADSVAMSASSGVIPPRQSYLTHIADMLFDREALSWEVSESQARAARARASSTSAAEVASYALRWMRPSQRTIGLLRPGESDFVATWSDARRLAGERMEIPPLTTPPAKRHRPAPVPDRALLPLPALSISTARRALDNGTVVRSATLAGSSVQPRVRLQCDCSDSTRIVAAERLLTSDAVLSNAGLVVRVAQNAARASDSSAEVVARRRALEAVGSQPAVPLEQLIAGVVTTAGAERTAERVTRVLASLPAGRRTTPSAAPQQRSSAPEERVLLANETQVAVVAALPGVPRDHPDRRALELLSYIVGVPSYGGRLGWALTKSGLTYAAAATNEFGARSGAILLSTECDTRNTDATIQAIREVVEGVGTRGVDDWELREAQAFMLGRATLYGAREDSDPDAIAAALIQSELGGLELDPPALSRAYLAITLDELNRVATKYYRPDRLRVVAAGAVSSMRESIFAPGTFRALFEP
jgi:zinc protease